MQVERERRWGAGGRGGRGYAQIRMLVAINVASKNVVLNSFNFGVLTVVSFNLLQ